jgi:hypothetical protein
MVSDFAWTQPVGGISLRWRPLNLRQEMEIEAAHMTPATAHLKKYVVIQRRICDYGGKPACTLEDLKEWDVIDLEMFIEEVELKEAERRASFMRKRAENSPGPVVELEASVMEMRATAMQFLAAADRALLAVKAVPPLGQAQP